MMSNEQSRERCLEVLGLEPEAAAHEIKTAYRDLAKVWHPDRFTHDPRLQQKAQEKLKEINDAYQRLLTGHNSTRSRHATRGTNTTRDSEATRGTQRAPDDEPHARRRNVRHVARDDATPHARRKIGWLALAPVFAFCATFAFVAPRLISSRVVSPSHDSSAAVEPSRDQQADGSRQTTDDEDAWQKNARKQKPTGAAARADSSASTDADADKLAAAATPLRALPTVSIAIDPATGLRARADCPNKLNVTFPAGEEPRAYCNAEHHRSEANATANEDKQAGKSRLKSFAGRLASPSKWFADKSSSDDASRKSAARDQSRDQD
jgi:hypothetical protein